MLKHMKHDMLKNYSANKSKNCSTEKLPNLDLALHNSQVALW